MVMISFGELPPIATGLMGCLFFLVLLSMFGIFVMELGRRRRHRVIYRAVIAAEVIVNYVVLQCILSANDTVITNRTVIRMVEISQQTPAVFFGILAFAQIIAVLLCVRRSFAWDASHITSNSLKEAVDSLPAGVCAYDMTGRVLLKNAAMERMCVALSGKMLFNGLMFEKAVEDYPRTDIMGRKKVYILPDESVGIFSREELDVKGSKLILLCAFDMTEEYEKTMLLIQKEKDVQELNAELVAYNRDIVSIVTSQEILNAKVKIHDELGAGLLSIRHYLLCGGGIGHKQSITDKLRRNIRFLQSEIEEKQKDEYELMISTAKALDVDIEIEGELPKDEPYKHVVATAIHECFTNTVRHAKGNLLKISVKEDEDGICVVWTNNGEKPKGEISEKGGLASLRSLVEASLGTMSISTENGFKLSIRWAKERANGI